MALEVFRQQWHWPDYNNSRFLSNKDFRTLQLMCYKLQGGGSRRLEGVTSHRERVRPVKERVGSSARDGDGEGGTNDVYASRNDFRTLQLMCYKLRRF